MFYIPPADDTGRMERRGGKRKRKRNEKWNEREAGDSWRGEAGCQNARACMRITVLTSAPRIAASTPRQRCTIESAAAFVRIEKSPSLRLFFA